MKRTLVIGDIHGGLKALNQLLERANVTEEDTLIFLGDYVDGWSQSAQVISRLMQLEESNPCIFIKGNHDWWCENWFLNSSTDPVWLNNGGQETIESYRPVMGNTRQAHLEFFKRMLPYHIDEQNRLFIHAGFTSMHGPKREVYLPAFMWDRTLWEMANALHLKITSKDAAFPQRLKLFHEIYIGHTPTLSYGCDIPMQGINVWNIDTGAAFTGRLSIMDIDTKAFWQSDVLIALYPNEIGRNK